MKLSLVIGAVACGLVAAPAAVAEAPVKQDRYLAWFEASVTQRSSAKQTLTASPCTGMEVTDVTTQTLDLRSAEPSVLVATRTRRTPTSFGGTLRALSGSSHDLFQTFGTEPCYAAIVAEARAAGHSVLPSSRVVPPPIELANSTLDVQADLEKPVVFSGFQPVVVSRFGKGALMLIDTLAYAAAVLTPSHLYAAKVEDSMATGSYTTAASSGSGASVTVTWKLTIRAVFDEHATRME